jgi:FkbM family methyltransferase
VDWGAFDADTVRRFLDRQQGDFHKIYAFEPDPENFRRLKDYTRTLATTSERVHVFRAAVGARRGRMQFDAGGGMGSSLSNTGAEQVDVLSLRDVIDQRELHGWLFLKIDVEGAEADALVGAAELLGGPQSIVAVCVYHRPNDLWELPAQLHSLAPDHELFLRTQGEDGMDVVCYAIPEGDRVASDK